MTATVSIILPVRAPAPWIDETLLSIRRQTMGDYVLVAVVDGHDKHLVERLHGEPRVVMKVNDSPQGVAQSRQAALHLVNSPLVTSIDADDLWPADHLQCHVERMTSEQGVSVLGTAALLIDQFGLHVGERPVKPGDRRRKLLLRNQFANSSAIFRTQEARAVGGYRPSMCVGEDYEMWLRLGLVGWIIADNERHIRYRLHPSQTSRRPLHSTDVSAIRSARLNLARSVRVPKVIAATAHEMWRLRQRVEKGTGAT